MMRLATPPTAPPVKRPWGVLLRVAASVAILAWVGRGVDWPRLAEAFTHLRWGYWLGAVGLLLVCQVLSSVRWMLMSRPLGFDAPLSRFVCIYFVGMFFNLLLPTSVGGDVVRAAYLNAGGGRKFAATLCVLVDRLSGLLVLLALACVAAVVSPVPLPRELQAMVAGAGVAAVGGIASLPLLTKLAGRFADKPGTIGRVAGKVSALGDAVRLYRSRPGLIIGTTALSVAVQALNVVLVSWVGLALRLDVPAVYYGVAAPMVTLLTLLPVSLNGMGVREGGMALFLAPAGVPAGDAVALAFLWFCVQTATSLAGAGAYLFGRFPRVETTSHDRAVDHRAAEGRAGQRRAAA